MKPYLAIASAIVLGAILFPQETFAHKVKLFAVVEGGEISGYAYYSGGAKVRGAEIEIHVEGLSDISRSLTDDEGKFRFKPTVSAQHRLKLTTKDAHTAEWTISAEELTFLGAGAFAGGGGEDENKTSMSKSEMAVSNSGKGSVAATDYDRIEEAVARQVGPLRREIEAYHEKILWHDILGGIGIISGIAGFAFYLRAAKGVKP